MALRDILNWVKEDKQNEAEKFLAQFSQIHTDLVSDRYVQLNQTAKPHQIVFLGDSITEEFPINEMLPTHTIYNRGISGNTSYDILARLDTHILPLKPSKLFLLVGINDLARPLTPKEPISAIVERISRIHQQIMQHTPECQFHFISVYPTNNSNDPKVDKTMLEGRENHKVIELNHQLEDYATQHNSPFINIYPLLLDSQKQLDLRYTREGLHLNVTAYRKILTQLLPYLS